jgi:tRNA dimethylallyltransferase
MTYGAVLIAGPTASGKSAAALTLAVDLGGIVVNADSMQVYRELSVLTARPSASDEARAPHRLYGHVPAAERYSAGRYLEDAVRVLAEARQKGLVPIFAGGTGLYFDVLENGLSPMPAIPARVRARVREDFERLGRDAFAAALYARDPGLAAAVRPSDTQRLLRAADILEATGTPFSQWRDRKGVCPLAGLRVARFVIAPPREVLWERTAARIDAMFESGALEEARGLMHLDPTLPAARALGVPQALQHLKGEIPLAEAIAATKIATRQYVKRQMTWFRNRMKDWIWLEATEISNNISILKDYFS